MSKPTEGPWYVGADDAADCPSHKNSGLAMVDTGRSADWPIARLVEWNNAPLLAAALDLLIAGKHALADSGCDGDLCAHTWHEEMRAAIAKAEAND